MTKKERSQTFHFHINSPPEAVYRAMLDPVMLGKWRVPDGLSMKIHAFEPSVGGKFRVSLIYREPGEAGKSAENSDTYHGHFKELIPGRKIVEVMEFESSSADFSGEMTITTELVADGAGTNIVATHKNLPEAVPADQNEAGWKMSFGKLAKLLEKSPK